MTPDVRLRLSLMMFFQYFVWGSWFVTLSTYLGQTLHFTGDEIGTAYSSVPIACIVSPFFVGLVADRFFATERILCLLHLVGAAVMYYASTLTTSSTLFPVLVLYALCYGPTLALTNSLSFYQMRSPAKEFPGIRVLGTIGWIAAGLLIGKLRLAADGSFSLPLSGGGEGLSSIEATRYPMIIAAIVQALLGVGCLFLPHTPPKKTGEIAIGDILGLEAIELMKDRSFAVFVIGSFLICIPLQFYYIMTNNFLNSIHVTDAAAKMTVGQMSEIIFMLVMPLFFVQLGVKYMLLVGMLAWTVRYFAFSFSSDWNINLFGWNILLFIGIFLHGICYDFFFVTGQIYVDHKAPKRIQASAQGFLALVTLGLGMFIGSKVCGHFATAYQTPDGMDWRKFWMVPAIGAGVLMVIFAFLFNESETIRTDEVENVVFSAEGPEPQVG